VLKEELKQTVKKALFTDLDIDYHPIRGANNSSIGTGGL